ncbi:MAG: ATP-binding protein [Chitinophagales bacterium]|nr:ATP-binding protein [Chitinophagales bacterium]
MSNVKKIVVIGPESTGKSTLSAALAVELGTLWVPEYAREYLERLDRPYEQNDLIEIAKGQVKLEDELAAKVSGTLICDTDLNVIKVWSEAKYNACDRYITEQIAERKYDLYLLTYIDTEWEDDPLREHPAPEERTYFYNIYRDIVQNSNQPWVDIRGTHEERLKSAMDAVRQIIL